MTTITETRASRTWLIILTSTAVGLYWFSMYLYVPTLPIYAQTKTEDLAVVGIVLAQYGLWQAVIRLPLGILSDWVGRRKPFIIGGLVLAGVGAWMMGSSGSITGVLVGRAVTGLAAGSWVVMVVAFSSLFPLEQAVRATALLTLINSASRMLATASNGSLNDLGGYGLAFILAAASAVAAVLVFLPVREDRLPSRPPSWSTTGRLIIRRDVLLPALLNAVLEYASYATIFGFFPILAKKLGADNVALSLLVSMNLAVSLVGNLAATSLAARFGTKRLILAGFGLTIAGILAAWLAISLQFIYLAQFLIGLGFGIAYPTLMGKSIERVEGPSRSTAMGLHQSVYAIGMFSGPWLSGILADKIGVQPMFAVTAVGILLLAGLGWSRLDP